MEIDCIDLTKDDDVNFRVPSTHCSAEDYKKDDQNIAVGYQPNYACLCPSHYALALIPRPCFVCHCDVTIPIPNSVPASQQLHLWRPFVDRPEENRISKRSRNPWGSMSYADLITKAIMSSPNKRLMLTQIYDWFVANVPYFSDKGDTNSSIGWKNSIRHNLSLHKRFVRLDSDGGVKSSYWTVNISNEKMSRKKYKTSRKIIEQNM